MNRRKNRSALRPPSKSTMKNTSKLLLNQDGQRRDGRFAARDGRLLARPKLTSNAINTNSPSPV